MKILLSAYACEPNHGSEPGVGWNWAVELAQQGHDVWVITRKSNKNSIESYFASSSQCENLKFIYFDLPLWARWWKNGGRGIRLYYFLWQMGAYRVAKKTHLKIQFDCVHHVTFVSVRQPSFMGNLGIPFIFGPVAGGESAPWRLRFGYGLRGLILDGLRDLLNLMIKFDPLMWITFLQADQIFVTSEQTKNLLPNKFLQKTKIQLAIGCEVESQITKEIGDSKSFRVLYVGHFIYLKGMHLGLKAFAKLLDKVPGATLTMVGEGAEEKKWKKLSFDLGIAEKVHWVPWLEQDKLRSVFAQHDVFLFPSLHDSGGMVVLEAMSLGLPVVCLGLGGPGIIVDESCGAVVPAIGIKKNQVIDALFLALYRMKKHPLILNNMSKGARQRVGRFGWKNLVQRIYNKDKSI